MHEPSLRTSRLAIAGGLGAAIILAGAGFVLGRMTFSAAESAPAVSAARSVPAAPPRPKVEPPRILGRAEIIAFANSAADALTTGAPLPAEVASAAGRRFEIFLPFGCDGPAPEESAAPMRWRYDAEKQTLRVRVAPAQWVAGDWGIPQTGSADRNFEGFWVSRPWSSADRCPEARGQAAAITAQPVTLPGQTLALAEILPEGKQRRDRPYETVQRVQPEDFAAAQGFRLRATGRIERMPDGQPIQCIQPAGIEQRPICLIVVSFDEIRIENPASNAMLATWSMRQASRNSP